MSAKKTTAKDQPAKPKPGILAEAWSNMNADLDRLLPEALRSRGKKKFMLWMLVLELVVLAVAGVLAYGWLRGE